MTTPVLIQPVVLSGGSGTRLWPLSREKYPKQLLSFIGDDSLLQATVRRVRGTPGIERTPPMVVCNEEYRFVIAKQLRLLGQSGTVVLDPFGRNTAPALTQAALSANQNQADFVLPVMPADHVITDVPAFQKVVGQGAVLAANGAVVTFDIMPDAGDAEASVIARFVEKPDLMTAQFYLTDGSYLWNSGLFIMRSSVWLSAMGVCRPDILTACQACLGPRQNRCRIRSRGKRLFCRMH